MKFFTAGRRLMNIDICADYLLANAKKKYGAPSGAKILQSRFMTEWLKSHGAGSSVKFDAQFVLANGMRFKSALTPNVYLQEGGVALQADGKGQVTSGRAFKALADTSGDAAAGDTSESELQVA